MKCNLKDCFNCPYPDCINDTTKYYNPEYQKKYRKEHRNEINELKRQFRARRKAPGLCVDCGKPIAENSKSHCIDCLLKYRKRSAEAYRKKKLVQAFKR